MITRKFTASPVKVTGLTPDHVPFESSLEEDCFFLLRFRADVASFDRPTEAIPWLDETGNVTLDASLPGVAAATVARIAFDKAAARQFRGIVNTGVKAAANRQKWYPRVGFPLVGATTITAEGVWVDRETDRAFLVHRLLSCSHPFPFKKLYYRSECANTKLGKPTVAGEPSHSSPEVSLKVRLDEAKGTSRTLASLAVLAQAVEDEVDPFPDLSAKQVRKVKQSARPGFSRSGRVADDGAEVDLGIGGASDGGPRKGDVMGREPREEAPSTAPKSMQELLWSRVQWGEKSILNFDAPMGGGPVARIELRLDDGRDVAYWACRLGLTMDGRPAPDDSILVIVAEEDGARDSTEMMLFKVASTDEVTPNRCAQLASAFWADDPTRAALEDDDVLVGTLTRERLALEHGGLALTVVVDRLLGAGDTEVLPERTRIRPA